MRILNDCLQGSAGAWFYPRGYARFLFDPRKGLYSYEALSRVWRKPVRAKAGVIDYSSPTLHLASLTPEELYIC
ncbi:BREX system ATP-binding domain-containing protein [Klebsiella pneumoniae]